MRGAHFSANLALQPTSLHGYLESAVAAAA
jgi:hypothetical protein